MWRRSFVATTVALGDSVDDALAAMGGGDDVLGRSASHVAHASHVVHASHAGATPASSGSVTDLVAQLRAPHRATRAAALAKAVHEIVLRIDEVTLR